VEGPKVEELKAPETPILPPAQEKQEPEVDYSPGLMVVAKAKLKESCRW